MSNGIKLSDWVTEEEFNYSPTGELSAVILLATERKTWFEKGQAEAEERIVKLFEALNKCDCDPDDGQAKHYRCAASKGLTPVEVLAAIKGENNG